tara:strand:- start:366 stop:872 length:507 start_codon:yes stop_codon:yes gene_type:complete
MNIFLIGMMGSGKSSVGSSLAKYLTNTFYDLDREVEKKFNLSIKDIFTEYGEDLFRKEESNLLKEFDNSSDLIISTGGGIVICKKNREILKQHKTYFLKAEIKDMYNRATKKENDRPLLKGIEIEEFEKLYLERENLYTECAKSIINVSNKSIEDITTEIVKNEENTI